MDGISLTSTFDASVPIKVQTALVGIVRGATDLAKSFCFSEFDRPEARDLLPHVKRSYVERGLAQLPDRFPDLTSIEVRQNLSGNSARVLRCGENVCMTASYLSRHDRQVPRQAEFRNDLAKDYNQMRLHPEAEDDRIRSLKESMKEIYAILCHRGTPDGELTGVGVVFVNADCRYITDIDLIARTSTRENEIEQISDEVRTQLRGDLARKLRGQG